MDNSAYAASHIFLQNIYMNISWQWLTELVDLQGVKPEYLAEKLTLAGFEVESISQNNLNNNIILEIGTTTNRIDTLSLVGLAREVSGILDRPLVKSLSQYNFIIKHKQITSRYSGCNNYLTGVITKLKMNRSPAWLRRRLIDSGVLPKYILEDIKNFIYLKWSQHIDLFDLDTFNLENYEEFQEYIKVQSGIKKDTFITPDNITLDLAKYNVVTVDDKDRPLAIPGVATNSKHAIKDNSINILAQIVFCNLHDIENISKNLKASSDNSYVQNRGLGAIDLLSAYSEYIFLLIELCGASVENIVYAYHSEPIYNTIPLYTENVSKILGQARNLESTNNVSNLDQKKIIEILKRLKFSVRTHKNYLEINPSLNRINDISREIDLIEEVGRIYGFDKFNGSLPYNQQDRKQKSRQYQINHLRSILRTAGLDEIIDSSLVEKEYTGVGIYNPLVKECNYIRSNLLSNIICANNYNLQQGNSSIEVFEIGRVFGLENSKYIERMHFAGIMGGNKVLRSQWSEKPRELSWFEAKGKMEEVFERLNTNIIWKLANISFGLLEELKTHFHPRRISILYVQNTPVGIFGQLNLPYDNTYMSNVKTYGFEILLHKINTRQPEINYFKPYPRYPSVTRDITISMNSQVNFDMIIDTITQDKNSLVESVDLFDCYNNTLSKDRHRNLGFRIKYRSSDSTLTTQQIDEVEDTIKRQIENKLQA